MYVIARRLRSDLASENSSQLIEMVLAAMREAGLEAIFMLSVACEARDHDTGRHVRRVQHYTEALARRIGLE